MSVHNKLYGLDAPRKQEHSGDLSGSIISQDLANQITTTRIDRISKQAQEPEQIGSAES